MLVRRNGESGGYADLSEAYPQLLGNGGFPFESFSWQADEGRRRRCSVFCDAARVLARTGARSHRAGFSGDRPERGVAAEAGRTIAKCTASPRSRQTSRAGQLRGLRLAGAARQEIKERGVAGESRLLFDLDHSRAGALDSRRLRRRGARHHLRFEVRRLRSREESDGEDPLCGSGRRFLARTAFLDTGTRGKCWSSSGSVAGRCSLRRICCRSRAASCPPST